MAAAAQHPTEQAARLACSGCWPQDDLPATVPCRCTCHDYYQPTPRVNVALAKRFPGVGTTHPPS